MTSLGGVLFLLSLFVGLVGIVDGQMYSPGAISQIDKVSGQYIMLTFDDGPHATLTPKLLDILKEKNAKATFYVMGVKAAMHPEIIKRAVEEGHEVGSHTWNHPVSTRITRENLKTQIERTTKAIRKATEYSPTTYRPPYGKTNANLNEYVNKEENMKVIMWNVDTNDWKKPPPEQITQHVLNRAKSGDIILCHDIFPGTIEAIPSMIDGMKAKGFEFITVQHMLELPDDSPHRRHLRSID